MLKLLMMYVWEELCKSCRKGINSQLFIELDWKF